MSEFLSACPKCRQRIMCDTLYVGQRVACPVCLQEIIMPAPPVEPLRPAAPAAGAAQPAAAPAAGGSRVPLPAVIIGAVVVLLAAGAVMWKLKGGPANAMPPMAAAAPAAPVLQAAVAPPDTRLRAVATPAVPGSYHKTKFVLVGDNTINETYGWGLGFKQYLTDAAGCAILAGTGRSTQSYRQEGHWASALALKGDYYLINFGLRSTDLTAFIIETEQYVDETRANGGQPILITPMVRRQWDKDGAKINSSLEPYAEAVRKVAAEKHVLLVDLHERSKQLCESLGKDGCYQLSPVKYTDGVKGYDGTGLNAKGSVMIARLVVDELRRVAPELAPDFRTTPREDLQPAAE